MSQTQHYPQSLSASCRLQVVPKAVPLKEAILCPLFFLQFFSVKRCHLSSSQLSISVLTPSCPLEPKLQTAHLAEPCVFAAGRDETPRFFSEVLWSWYMAQQMRQWIALRFFWLTFECPISFDSYSLNISQMLREILIQYSSETGFPPGFCDRYEHL